MEGYVLGINVVLLLAVIGAIFRAGRLDQQVKDQQAEIERMRNRLDTFLDGVKSSRYPGC